MKIKIHTPECNLSFALPTRVIFSGFMAKLVCHGLNHTKILHKSHRKSTSFGADPVGKEMGEGEIASATEELKRAQEELEALEAEAALEEADDFPEELEEDADEDAQGHRLSSAQMRELFKALRECRKEHPGLVLVDVHSAAGEDVQITL